MVVDEIKQFDGSIGQDGTVTIKGLKNLTAVYKLLHTHRQPIIIKEKVKKKTVYSIVAPEEVITSVGIKLKGVD